MAEVKVVLKVELEVAGDVDVEEEAVLQDGLLAFVAPGVDAIDEVLLVVFGVVDDVLQGGGVGSFQNEEAHEVELIAEGDVAVPDEAELVAQGEACAEVVAAHGEVVGCCTAEGYGRELEVLDEGDGFALPFGMEACTETSCLADEGEVARSLVCVVAVVVDVFDVLVEADVEFPAVGQLALDGADASCDVELAYGGMVGVEVDEGIDVEVVEGTGGFAEVEVVEVVAIGEADIEVGDVLVVAATDVGMDGSRVVHVAVAQANLEGVGFGFLFLASREVVNVEHLARHHAVDASHGVEHGADELAQHALAASLGVVEEDVGGAVGHLTDGCTADACGEEVVGGRAVGLAEEFPSERANHGVEEGHAVGESVFACGIVEHAAVVGMGELVARETVVVPHPAACEVLVQGGVGHSCPYTVGDEVVPTEDEGVDANVFDHGLQGRSLGSAVGLLAEEVEGTGVGGEGVGALQVGSYARDGIVPDGVRLDGVCHDDACKAQENGIE